MKNGFGLIEVVIAVAIIAVAVAFLFNVAVLALRISDDANQRIIAANLLEEGYEIVRNVRDDLVEDGDWNDVEVVFPPGGTTRCFDVVGGTYDISGASNCALTSHPDFTRTINVAQALRNESNELDQTPGGSTESEALFFTITVAWDDGDSSEELKFYLTNFK